MTALRKHSLPHVVGSPSDLLKTARKYRLVLGALCTIPASLAASPAMAGCNSGDLAKTALLSSVGCSADASGTGATAVGGFALATVDYATAFGYGAYATGVSATALGYLSGPRTGVAGATTVGANAGNAGAGIYSTAIGAGPNSNAAPAATGSYSVAVGGGDGTVFTPTSGNAINMNGALASGFISTAVGAASQASGGGSSAFGLGSRATANDSAAFGDFSTASGASSVAVGLFSAAGGNNSTAVGNHASATGGSSSAYGQISRASGVGSTALGYASKATGSNSVALGRSSSAGGTSNNGGTTAVGYGAQAGTGAAAQTNATAIGTGANANAANSSAFGVASNASGASSLALGSGAQATAQNAVAIGSGSVADAANVVSVGALGSNRRIIHVAGAVDPNDAVNLKQAQNLVAGASVRASSPPYAETIRDRKKAATSTERFIAGNSAGYPDGSGASARNDRHASLSGADVVHSRGHTTRAAVQIAPVSCEFDGSKVTTASGEQSSASPAFSLIPQSGISFQQGGSAAGCVTLSVSAEAMAPGSSIMEVRAVLDGSIEASPGPVFFAQEDEAFHMRGFNFLFVDIAPGPHRLEIQFRNAGDEGVVRIGQRTIMLQFAR